MTTSDILLQDYDLEIAMTRRVVERVPEGKPDFKCHEKSMPLGKLTMHVATLPAFGTMILGTPSIDMAVPGLKWPDQTFHSPKDALAKFDAAASECRAVLAGLSDEQLAAPWKFSFGDRVISDGPKSLAYRHMFFNHLIHHRSQLLVYLRLNDIPVPGIYGPSADEPIKS
ncbi:MAG: DinB family protein [Acidobacteriota bacterium]|nr:DinB family protein [Acidobacteriota bacterium]